jgi:hypothetical protein
MTRSMRLAEEDGETDSAANWVRAEPFGDTPMMRLTLGNVGFGKTVGARAAASRVLDAVPNARIVVFSSIPGEYDPLAHALSEKSRESETGDIPSAKRFPVTEEDRLSLSASDLPPVSIVEPEAATRPQEQNALSQALEDFLEGISNTHQQRPTYLILDDAYGLFRASESVGLQEMREARQRHESLAVQIVTHTLDGGQFGDVAGSDRLSRRPTNVFDTIDLYYSESREQRKRFGLSVEDAAFVRTATGPSPVVGSEAGTTVRDGAPTGLCYTADEGWQRVRHTLTEHEAETLLASSPDPSGSSPTTDEDGEVSP